MRDQRPRLAFLFAALGSKQRKTRLC